MNIYNFDQMFFLITLDLALLFSFHWYPLGEFLGSHGGIMLTVTPPPDAPLGVPGGSMDMSNWH